MNREIVDVQADESAWIIDTSESKNLYLRTENFADMKAKVAVFRRFRKIGEKWMLIVVMSVRLSAWKNSAPTGRIFIKFDIGMFFEISVEKTQFFFNI